MGQNWTEFKKIENKKLLLNKIKVLDSELHIRTYLGHREGIPPNSEWCTEEDAQLCSLSSPHSLYNATRPRRNGHKIIIEYNL